MKINFTLQDVANYMISCSDHSDIDVETASGVPTCFYHIFVTPEGKLASGDEESTELWTRAAIKGIGYDEEDEEYDEDEDDEEEDDRDIFEFLDRFDTYYETLDNPYFHEAAEDLMDQAKAL